MSVQMSLLAASAEERLEVPVAPEVLIYGAKARADRGRGELLFPHRHVPSPPPKLPDEEEWLAALDFAEEARRYNQAPRAILDLSERAGAGSNGPMGRGGPRGPMLMASGRGVEVAGRLATWPQLLAGRQEQREVEPEVARARDLAEAYHYLDYYGRVYEEPEPGEEWSPVPLIRRLALEARELGGDPTLLEPHTDYMRRGLEPDQSADSKGASSDDRDL
jgi:hypothetical protein